MSFSGRLQLARDRQVTVANLVDELLQRRGESEVSVGPEGTYRLSDLHRRICNIDAFLRRAVRLKPGQAVAIYRSNDRECFHWFLAIIRAGGVAVPLNPQLSLAEVKRILAESGTEILVTDTTVFERSIRRCEELPVRTWIQVDEQRESIEGFLRPQDAEDYFDPVTLDPKATIAVFHTSGTTGFPKGAALSSNALLGARASTVLAGLFLGKRDLALVALPWSHIMAVSIALYGLMAGIRGCFLNKFEAAAAVELVERFGVTAIVGVPAMFTSLVNSRPDPRRLKTVRVWLSAADALPEEIRRQLRQYGGMLRLPLGWRLPPVLLNGYGMVELGGLAMMGVELSLLPGSGDLCFPMPPYRVRIVDGEGHSVRRSEPGELQIRRRGIHPHYWRDGDASTGLLTSDGWLRTGDLAKRNLLGFIRLVGREKDVIKAGGYSVYVRELEEAILSHPAVARAVAFGLPHREKGEVPVAAVELQQKSSANEDDLIEWCRARLAGYKAPRRIWIVESGGLPQNHNGKMLRRELKDRFAGMLG